MPHPLHEQVRQAFGFRCGYCRVDETGAGAELTVDHFRPSAVGGADDLENLVYACFRCNLYKGIIGGRLKKRLPVCTYCTPSATTSPTISAKIVRLAISNR